MVKISLELEHFLLFPSFSLVFSLGYSTLYFKHGIIIVICTFRGLLPEKCTFTYSLNSFSFLGVARETRVLRV